MGREGKTGVTADRDKIEFRLFSSSSIFNIILREELFALPKQNQIMNSCHGFMALVTWVKFFGEKLKATIPLGIRFCQFIDFLEFAREGFPHLFTLDLYGTDLLDRFFND